MVNAISAVGGLFHSRDGVDSGSFLGTCFAYRTTEYVLTAAHCVGDLDPSLVVSVWPPVRVIRRALQITKHENVDIAIIRFPEMTGLAVDPFLTITPYEKLGEDFYAIGFTEGLTGVSPTIPTARLYKGHFQRFFHHQSFLGYRYWAGELSIPSPGGLSGGPIFLPYSQQTLIGLVTENVLSTTVLDSIQETLEDGKEYAHFYQAVIRFGVCLMLDFVRDWIEQQILPT